jgi:hypothetical protein
MVDEDINICEVQFLKDYKEYKKGQIKSYILNDGEDLQNLGIAKIINGFGIISDTVNSEKIPMTLLEAQKYDKIKRIEENTISLKTILSNPIKKPEWIVENIIPTDGVTIFGGASQSYKTWLAQMLAVNVSSGTLFLGNFDTKQEVVMYFDEENGEVLLYDRFKKLCQGADIDPPSNLFVSVYSGIKLDMNDSSSILLSLVDKFNPKLLIFDSMVRIMEGDENQSTDVRLVFDTIKPILEKNISVLIIHHTGKKNNNDMLDLRGSSDFGAFAHVIVMFKREKSHIVCNMVKNRYIDISNISEFKVKIGYQNGDSDKIFFAYDGLKGKDLSAAEVCKADLENLIMLRKIVSFTSFNIESQLFAKSHSKKSVFSAINMLLEENKIRKLSRGTYEVITSMFVFDEETIE